MKNVLMLVIAIAIWELLKSIVKPLLIVKFFLKRGDGLISVAVPFYDRHEMAELRKDGFLTMEELADAEEKDSDQSEG